MTEKADMVGLLVKTIIGGLVTVVVFLAGLWANSLRDDVGRVAAAVEAVASDIRDHHNDGHPAVDARLEAAEKRADGRLEWMKTLTGDIKEVSSKVSAMSATLEEMKDKPD